MPITFRYGGIEFGGYGRPLIVTDFDPGPAEIRVTNADRPGADGVIPGRVLLGGAVWALEITTDAHDAAGARALTAPLATAWRDPTVRLAPGVTVPLSYNMGGQWRRVYGRPELFDGLNADVRTEAGAGTFALEFRVTDPHYYAEQAETLTLTAVPASTGGLVAPLAEPLSTARSSEPRAGLVDNLGDEATPLTVTFTGPGKNPTIRAAAGWEIGLVGTLAYDEAVTIDARAGTVKRSDGTDVPGMLSRATRLSRAVLPPGPSELTFAVTDQTATATAVASWRPAYSTL
jgi:hypothetical protein